MTAYDLDSSTPIYAHMAAARLGDGPAPAMPDGRIVVGHPVRGVARVGTRTVTPDTLVIVTTDSRGATAHRAAHEWDDETPCGAGHGQWTPAAQHTGRWCYLAECFGEA